MNSFKRLNPWSVFCYFGAVVASLMISDNPLFTAEALVGASVFLTVLNRGKNFFSDLLFYIILFLLITAVNPLFSHNGKTPLFFMNSNPVTLEAILCGAASAAVVIGVIMWFSCMTRVFTSDKFYYIFAKFSPKLALVFSYAMGFLPRLKREFIATENAQKALGVYSSDSFFDRLRLKLKALSSITMQSAEDAVITSQSMNSKGYGVKKRTSYVKASFGGWDIFLIALSLSTLVYRIITELSDVTVFDFYPTLTKISFDFFSITAYASYGILCFMPIIIEITESLKWKYFVSKI